MSTLLLTTGGIATSVALTLAATHCFSTGNCKAICKERKEKDAKDPRFDPETGLDFISAERDTGSKPGYVFKTEGAEGRGYYRFISYTGIK